MNLWKPTLCEQRNALIIKIENKPLFKPVERFLYLNGEDPCRQRCVILNSIQDLAMASSPKSNTFSISINLVLILYELAQRYGIKRYKQEKLYKDFWKRMIS